MNLEEKVLYHVKGVTVDSVLSVPETGAPPKSLSKVCYITGEVLVNPKAQ